MEWFAPPWKITYTGPQYKAEAPEWLKDWEGGGAKWTHSKAPGLEVAGCYFKSKEKSGKFILLLLRGPQAQTEPIGNFGQCFGPTTLGGPPLMLY